MTTRQPLPWPAAPGDAGPHLVYLDVWQREVTHARGPEPGRAGARRRHHRRGCRPSGRSRCWPTWAPAHLRPLDDVSRAGTASIAPSAGRLTTATVESTGRRRPCLVPPGGGYKGLENQLYRVEIHDGGGLAAAATFKWSRDNASVASASPRSRPRPARRRRASAATPILRFRAGDWVEVTDDWREFAGLPGEHARRMRRSVDDATRTIRSGRPCRPARSRPTPRARPTPARHTRVRRWDQHGRVANAAATCSSTSTPPAATGVIPVPPAGTPSCSSTASPSPSTSSRRGRVPHRRPLGVRRPHRRRLGRGAGAGAAARHPPPLRRLAIVTFPDAVTDCRTLWPPDLRRGRLRLHGLRDRRRAQRRDLHDPAGHRRGESGGRQRLPGARPVRARGSRCGSRARDRCGCRARAG